MLRNQRSFRVSRFQGIAIVAILLALLTTLTTLGAGSSHLAFIDSATEFFGLQSKIAPVLSNGQPAKPEEASQPVTSEISASFVDIALSLPDVTATPGDIVIPVTVGDLTGQNVFSYDLQITFDPAVVQPTGSGIDTAGTLSSAADVTSGTSNPGHLIISGIYANGFTGSGTLIKLKFTVQNNLGTSTSLAFVDYTDPGSLFHSGARFNEGSPNALTTNGSVTIPAATATSTSTATYTPTATSTETFTPTPTATETFTPTPTATNTFTPTPTATNTFTPTATSTSTFTPTATSTSTFTPSATSTATFTPTPAGPCNTGQPIEVSGTITGTAFTGYATLGAAFTAINGGTHTGVLTIYVCGNTTETATAALNASGTGLASYTSATMSPFGGAARTITGALALPLINLNGADNVTIDGLNTAGNSLTISNTSNSSTTGTSTIQFINDASSNTVTNCSLQSSSLVGTGVLGGAVVFSTGTTTGNDGNTISNNNIGPAGANLPIKLIYSAGTTTSAALQNSGNIINNNKLFDFFGVGGVSVRGIDIGSGNDQWTISNNRIYQTATRTFTTTLLRYTGISIASSTFTTNSFTVTGNIIGFGSGTGTGTTTITGSTNEFRGLDLSAVGSAPVTATSVQNNTISGINQTTGRNSTTGTSACFIGIVVGTSTGRFDIGTTTGNTIGSLDGSSTIVVANTSVTANTAGVTGIYDNSFVNANSINNNNIGAITINNGGSGTGTGFRGIVLGQTTGISETVNNNTIGSSSAPITDNIVGSYGMFGIQSISVNMSATGNTIRNFVGNSTSSAAIVSSGIIASGSTGANTVSQNTIHSLSNASGAIANSIYGMSLGFPAAANLVERNFIHSLSLTTTLTGSQIWGISGGATGTTTYQNNMIRLGHDAAGASITLPTSMIGIRDTAGATNQFYHNTVYIGGTGVLATPTASNSYCFLSNVVTVTRNFQDNIFWNARSNAVAGGVAHLAISVGGTAANPAGLTSNYNVLYFSGTDGATGVFNAAIVPTLAAWRTATGQDVNSFHSDPQLIAPTGTASTVNLHLHPTNSTVAEGNGVLVASVTNDFDGQTRSGLTPVDIGADAGNFTGVDLSPPSIIYTAFANTSSTANRVLAATITDVSGVAGGATSPRIYFKKSTDAGYVSTQCAGSYSCTIDYSLVGGGLVTANDIIQYFVVAQDTLGNVGSNPGGVIAASVNSITTPPSPNSYTIQQAISGTKTVCSASCDYTSLTNTGGVFAAVNSSVLTGNLTINITGNLSGELGTVALNQAIEEPPSSNFTITIKPNGGAWTVTGAAATSLIRLDGADRVTVDGSQTGSTDKSLIISNTNTSGATIHLLNSATLNTFKNLDLQGVSTSISNGTVFVATTATGVVGNNTNTFQANDIHAGASAPAYGFYNSGTSTAKNTNTLLIGNRIYDFSNTGIFDAGSSVTATYRSNEIYEVVAQTTALVGFRPSATSIDGFTFDRNFIHDLNTSAVSTVFGVHLFDTSTVNTSVLSNNMITLGAAAPLTLRGIYDQTATGEKYNLFFNSIYLFGSVTGASTSEAYYWSIASTTNASGNIFFNDRSGGTGKHYSYRTNTTLANLTSNYNDIFNTGGTGNVFGNNGTADVPDLATWKSAPTTGTGTDANSISANPLFISAANLHVASTSPVLDAAVVFGGIVTDFDGQTRPLGSAYDIGADEQLFGTPTATSTSTNTPLSSPTFTNTATPTNTATQTSTATATSTSTNTPTPTATAACTPANFTNATAIASNDAAPGSPYPSNISVSGLSGTVYKVTVTLNGFTHTFPDDMDILLVGPGGQNAIIMSDAGGGNPGPSNVTFTLDDDAATALPDSGGIVAGTFRPANYTGSGGEAWAAPAPAPVGGSALSTFVGQTPNGTWSLYVVDDEGGDTGSFAGGWTITIITDSCPTPTATSTSTFTPTATSTSTFTPTSTATQTFTPTPTATSTFTPTATSTDTATPTSTSTSTATSTSTNTPTPTPTAGSCPVTVLPNNGGTSGNERAPNTNFAYGRSVYLITAAEMVASGYVSGSIPTSIGWNYAQTNIAGSAPLTVYMQNTGDATNLKSTTWATAITGMTTVHNATTALPAVTGPFDITLTGGLPFTYTGGGIYVAFDWGQYTGTGISNKISVVSCNSALTNGLKGAQSDASAPATVANSSFRPETRLGGNLTPAPNDAAVTAVYSYGELPLGLAPAQNIKAVITNNSGNVMTNLPVTLNITGVDTFSDVQTIPSIAGCGGQATVTFAAFTPGSIGSDTVSVSVPADAVPANDSQSKALNITSADFSYKHPGSTASGGVGLTGATGAFVSKFATTTSRTITDVKLEFFAASATTYKVAIYGDNAGAPSTTALYVDAANRTVAAAGPVTITLPAPVAVGPGNFYVGIQQTNTTNVSLSFDNENPIRSGSFFLATPNPPTAFFDFAPGNNFKLNIGLILGAAPTPTATATNTFTPTPTATETFTPTATATETFTPTPSATNTFTPTPSATNTSTPTATATETFTPTATATQTFTPTATATETFTPTATATETSTPTETATNTPTPTPTAAGVINGTISYGNANGAPTTRYISNVQVDGAGSPAVSANTGGLGPLAGQYSLTGFGGGAYTVTPSKTGGVNSSINSFDAGKIAQHVAGISLLTGNAKVAADTTGNNAINSFDAAQIARYVVSLPPYAFTAQWRFYTVASVPFPVGSTPTSRFYPSVSGTTNNEDYTGLLIGEVSGNWANTGARHANGPERSTSVAAPRLVTPADSEVLIPVAVQGAINKGIISYEFNLRYDPAVIQPQANVIDLTGTVSRGLTAVANTAESGLLRVAVYGAMPIESNGVLMNLRFTAVGAPGTVSTLTWEHVLFNEGDPGTLVTDGQVELSAAAANQAEMTGRVVNTMGQGIPNALVTMTDTTGATRSVVSNGFGVYRFGGLQVGQTFTLRVDSKALGFTPLTVSVTGQSINVDMIAAQ